MLFALATFKMTKMIELWFIVVCHANRYSENYFICISLLFQLHDISLVMPTSSQSSNTTCVVVTETSGVLMIFDDKFNIAAAKPVEALMN